MGRSADAGYSGTPLPRKLGIKPGMRIAILGAPNGYVALLDLPEGAIVSSRRSAGVELVQVFVATATHGARAAGRRRPMIVRSRIPPPRVR